MPGTESLDVTGLIQDPRHILLMFEGGGIIFVCQEPGIYEVHTNFLASHRGRHALRCSLTAYRWMFTHTDCMTLLTKVPAFNIAAERFCRIVGATREFVRKEAWPTKDGLVDQSYWSLRFDDWARQTPDLIEAGHAFHEKAEAEYRRLGRDFPGHPEDEFHDRMAGACTEMVYGGQPEKGIVLYNRYARFAGYPGIGLVSRDPLLIDTGDAVLQVGAGDFKMVLCRLPKAAA